VVWKIYLSLVPIDGLKGFPEAIRSTFPKTEIQLCIIHQIRHSIKYVGSKDQKAFMSDLKQVYQAPCQSLRQSSLSLMTNGGPNTRWYSTLGRVSGMSYLPTSNTLRLFAVLSTQPMQSKVFIDRLGSSLRPKGHLLQRPHWLNYCIVPINALRRSGTNLCAIGH